MSPTTILCLELVHYTNLYALPCMADVTEDLLAITVDAADDAETASGEGSHVSRTYQSEADFQAQKAKYSAKTDNGNNYQILLKAVPQLNMPDDGSNGTHNLTKARLSKKDAQLLGYAVGELYYDKDYEKVVELCVKTRRVCEIDEKMSVILQRWIKRCEERLYGLK